MHIEEIEVRYVVLPLVHPFETSFGREDTLEAIIVAVRGEGITGWGEAATTAGPWYEYETAETCWHVLNDFLAPAVVGHQIDKPEDVVKLMAPVRGHHLAKMGIESAVWDALGKAESTSVSAMLGGVRDRVSVGISIGIQDSVPALLDRIAGFWGEGYRRVKIKIRPGWDTSVVREVRERFTDLPLMVDANSAYSLANADCLLALDDYDLIMIEQPLAYDDLVDHAALQCRIRTPICLDESVPSLATARAALALGSGRIVNIQPGRVGGLTVARAIHDLCREHNVPVWCGGLFETGIGRAHNVALASLPGFRLTNDIPASARHLHEDIVEQPFVVNEDGTMTVPTGPGIGVAVHIHRLDAGTRRKATIK